LARLDPAIARLCDRAPTSERPEVQLNESGPVPAPVRAGLRCGLGGSQPDFVLLWDVPRHQSLSYVDLAFFRRVGDTGAHVGDCGADDKAYMDWSFGLHAGKLLCVATPTRARFDWTFGGEDVLATAERDDGDRAALYQWWLETGRGILH